ncbi:MULTISPECIES: nodulation protein NfeD [unclassified Paenibacillus]|uniref:NfeD family protein n=1 Tax=unclassified Paenibacillus TaxID=185978 RepID=UPI00104E5E65|nr:MULTISPECIES: nodulation protein NfeD [unclassified Paenibacillus]NIK67529.1 membrane-bound serine protease (ClpP class) [Paenibacillus sp. BK720]TCN01571.1 membrane-bound serine protease (ClpP class) [Paenibacillus sp. BK033]
MQTKRWRIAAVIWPLLMLVSMLLVTAGGLATGSKTAHGAEGSALGPAVYVVPVKQTVESGLKSFLERAYQEAAEAKAERVVLVINTFGGEVTSAEEIGELIRKSSVPTTAYVEGKAVSAGTYIALNAQNIVMEPGSTIGAAAVVNGSGDLIDNPKVVSFWVKTMREAAELNGRDPDIAAAMVDPGATLPLPDLKQVKQSGQILTLTADEAIKVGYAEYKAESLEDAIKWLGLENRDRIELKPSIAEKIASWLVNPIVMTVLFILGIAGIAIELFVPGFGVPGIVGILSFGLYFFGHYIAGFAGMESVVLFIVGIALLLIEVFVPSWGILGILGSASLIAGVLTAASNPMTAFISLVIALAAAAVILYFVVRKYKDRGIWNKFILREKLTTEQGYLSAETKEELLGQEGIAITPLRPAGTIQIGDNRIDVVTSGEFIASGKTVKVIKTEGTWVVVREVL